MPRLVRALLIGSLLLACREPRDVDPRAPAPGEVEGAVDGTATISTARGVRIVEATRARFEDALAPAEVERLVVRGERRVAVARAGRGREPAMAIDLPIVASGSMSLESRGVRASITPLDVAGAPLELAEGLAVYPDVQPGVHLFRRVDARGVEDLFSVETPRDALDFAFDVALERVAGVRFVGGVVELLDPGGAPRLRATAPIATDAAGTRRAGVLALSGCAFDTDPRGPWGRAPVAPGAARCRLRARIDARGLQFPVLVDPAWVATFATVETHAFHALLPIPTGVGAADEGKVLALGGTGSGPAVTELFDPATSTWAASSSLGDATGFGAGTRAVMLSTGAALLAGGFPATGAATSSARPNVLLRRPDGTVVAAVAMSVGRAFHAMVVVTVGGKEQVLVAGGQPSTSLSTTLTPFATAELYDPATDAWRAAASMSAPRTRASALALADGRVVVAGGETGIAAFPYSAPVASTEVFAPSTATWSAGPSLHVPRTDAAIAPLTTGPSAGGLVIGGGYDSALFTLDSLEVVDPALTAWTKVAARMGAPRQDETASTLVDGRVVFAGGGAGDPKALTPTFTTELFDPATGAITAGPPMLSVRMNHAATSLGSRGVLLTGGWTTATGGETDDSELLDLAIGVRCTGPTCAAGLTCTDGVCCTRGACPEGQTCNAPGHEGVCTKPQGATCATNVECATGYCVGRFCCDGACSGSCRSCDTPGSEGTCVLAAEGTDPGGSCGIGAPDPTCGKRCDGTGKCGAYAGTEVVCGSSLLDGGGPFCDRQRCSGFGTCNTVRFDCGLTCTSTVTCDEASRTCAATPAGVKSGFCVIDLACWGYGDPNPKNACEVCDPPTSKVAWSVAASCADAGGDGGDAAGDARDGAPGDALDAVSDATDGAPRDGDRADADATASDAAPVVDAPGPEVLSGSGCSCRSPAGANGASFSGVWSLSLLGSALALARRRRARLATGRRSRILQR